MILFYDLALSLILFLAVYFSTEEIEMCICYLVMEVSKKIVAVHAI